MHKFLVAALSFAFLVSVGGCKHDDMDDDMDHDDMKMEKSGMSEKKMSDASAGADQCSQCEGVQKLNADGTCPGCKMKAK